MPEYTIRFVVKGTWDLINEIDDDAMADTLVDFPGVTEVESKGPVLARNAGAGHGKVGRPPQKGPEAEKWLRSYLRRRRRPVPAGKVITAALEAGHAEKTLRRAAYALGVQFDPPGGGPSVVWSLPPDINDQEEAA